MDIETIKRHPDVFRLYASRVSVRKSGSGWVGHCPLHSDNRESLSLYWSDDGVLLWKCHSEHKEGNIVQFISELERVSIAKAAKKAEEELKSSWSEEKQRVDAAFRPVPAGSKNYKTFPLANYGRLEADFEKSPEALAYLESRGITLETAKKLHFGFVKDVGKLAGSNNQDIASSGWMVYPSISGDRVVSIKYRSIARKAFCRYPGMATVITGGEDIDLFEPLFVVEGDEDRAIMMQCGFRCVSIPSASTPVNAEDLDKIASASAIYLAGDCGDKTGVGADAMTRIQKVIPSAKLITWPDGVKDANDVFLKKCEGNGERFVDLVNGLISQSAISPMPGVYDAAQGMLNATTASVQETKDRFVFPWADVDNMAVIGPGSVTTLYAPLTGSGKTTFAIQATLYNALNRGERILNYQMELTPDEMYRIFAAHLLQKDRRDLTVEDIREAGKHLAGVKYYIGRDPDRTTADQAIELIDAAVRHLNISTVVLDHLHHLTDGAYDENKAQASAMKKLKDIAQKYSIKMVILMQPRKPDKKGVRLAMDEIKGTGSNSNVADVVLGLHRDALPPDEAANSCDNRSPKTEIHLLKGRALGHGKPYTELLFRGELCTFFEIDHREEAPPPATMFE